MPPGPASADDRPQQHGITDELAHLFLKRFLPVDARFVMNNYKYRPIASLGEGYTTMRKVLEVGYRDEKSGKEDVAVFVVKVPCKYTFKGMRGSCRHVLVYALHLVALSHKAPYGESVYGGGVGIKIPTPESESTPMKTLPTPQPCQLTIPGNAGIP